MACQHTAALNKDNVAVKCWVQHSYLRIVWNNKQTPVITLPLTFMLKLKKKSKKSKQKKKDNGMRFKHKYFVPSSADFDLQRIKKNK